MDSLFVIIIIVAVIFALVLGIGGVAFAVRNARLRKRMTKQNNMVDERTINDLMGLPNTITGHKQVTSQAQGTAIKEE